MERLSRHFLCLAVTEVKDRQRPLAVVGALPGKNQARAPVKCENSDSHQHLYIWSAFIEYSTLVVSSLENRLLQ